MGRLNLRLACSIGAASILLVLALLPMTAPLVERQFWVLTGTYQKRTGQDPADYVNTNHDDSDQRIVLLLTGYNRITVEARAFELGTIASRRKQAPLWAHVIRQTAMVPLQTKPLSKDQRADQLRRDSLAALEYESARAGGVLDPENVFFDLSEATGLAKQGKWDQILPSLERGAKATHFEDYIFDDFKRRVEYFKTKVPDPLPSEFGQHWASILLPHFSNYGQLILGLKYIQDERDRLRAGLALAKIGLLLEQREEYHISRLVGAKLVRATAAQLADPTRGSSSKIDFPKSLQAVIAKSHELGLTDVEAGWRQFVGWEFKPPVENPLEMPFDQEQTTNGVNPLFVLIVFGGVGIAVWLWSQVDPSPKNIWTAVAAMAAVTTLFSLTLDDVVLLETVSLAWILIVAGFLLARLPGRERYGHLIALGGLGLSLVSTILSGHTEILGVILVLWLIPFAFTRYIKRGLPVWLGVGISFLFFGGCGLFIGTHMSTSIPSYQEYLPDTVGLTVLLSVVWIPWVAAVLMSLLKMNLPDALRVILKPMPLLALIAAGVFAEDIRTQYRMEKLWKATSAQELPENYRQLITD